MIQKYVRFGATIKSYSAMTCAQALALTTLSDLEYGGLNCCDTDNCNSKATSLSVPSGVLMATTAILHTLHLRK